jgi:hypothetical protein
MSNGTTQLGKLGVAVKDASLRIQEAFANHEAFRDLQVSNANGFNVLPQDLELEGSHTFDLGSPSQLLLGIGGSLAYRVQAFNTPDDEDPDAVIVVKAGEGWLKHEVEAGLKGNLAGDAGSLSLKLDGTVTARLIDYRQFPDSAEVGPAILEGITGARFATSLENVLALSEGEALVYQVRGGLTFSASVSYGHALGATVSALDGVLGVAGASAFKVEIGASIGLTLGVSDDFRLVFRRGGGDRVAVDLKKAAARRVGVDAKLGVEVSLTNPSQLSGLIKSYLVGRLGAPLDKLTDLLNQVETATTLPDLGALQPLAEQLADRLGITDLQSRFAEFKDRLAGLEGRLATALETALTKGLKVALTFSYTRVESNETILRFEGSPAALAALHRPLLLGRLAPVTEAMDTGNLGISVQEFMQTTEVSSTRSLGFSLAVGDWGLGSSFEVEKRWRTQRNRVDGTVRASFDGRRSYFETWLKKKENYAFELSGAMEDFAPEAKGRYFRYVLTLGWMWEDKADQQLLETILDLASLWRIALLDLEALDGLSGKVRAELNLRLTDEGVRKLAEIPEARFQQAWVQAMAEALPPIPIGKQFAFRRTLSDRLRIYADAARFAFQQVGGADLVTPLHYSPGHETSQLKLIDLHQTTGAGNLPTILAPWNLFNLWRFRPSDVNTDNHPAGRCRRVFGALLKLQDGIGGKLTAEKALKDAFGAFDLSMRQAFLLRMTGSILAQLLGPDRQLLSGSVTIQPLGDGEEIVVA